MKYTFSCSLVRSGLIGGGLFLDDEALTYKTGKLTIEPKLRNLVLPLKDITGISWKTAVFPIATVTMADGEEYSFMIFSKARFEKAYAELKGE